MSDLISRKDAVEAIMYGNSIDIVDRTKLEQRIKELPTIEAEPVVHGEWIMRVRSNSGYVASITCSACGYSHSRVTYNFCPECGADMRKGGANNV